MSTDEQVAEGLSLDAQAQAVRHYCALRNLELATLLTDPGVSAGTPLAARPAGRELAELVTARRVGAVVALRLDRLFHDAGDCLAVTRRWDAGGVALHLLDLGGQSLDTSSAMGRFFLTVMAGAAELERNLVRERTRLSYAHLRQSGVYHSSRVPMGYVREPAVNVEPIVDETVWHGVQALMAAQTRLHPRSRDAAGAFGGLLTCGACGSPVWRSGRNRGKTTIYYRCSRARQGQCDQRNFGEHVIWEQLLPHLLDHLDPKRARRRQAEADPAQEAAAARLAAIGDELQRLTSAYTAAGRLGEPEFLAAAEVLWAERDALEASRADQAAPLPIALPATRRELRRVLDGLTHDERGILIRRVLVSAMVQDGHLVGPPRLR